MTKNKKIKSLTYNPINRCWILNDKYEIDNLGQIFWVSNYIGKRSNFSKYVFEIAEQLKGTFYYKFNKQWQRSKLKWKHIN